jgi:hypothetical protein
MFKATLTDGTTHELRAEDIYVAIAIAEMTFGVGRVSSVEKC